MPFVSQHIRSEIADLGRLSMPLGDVAATKLAKSLMMSLSKSMASGADAEGILKSYRVRILDEIAAQSANAAAASRPAQARASRKACDILPHFSASDHFQSL